jgi:3-phytase
MNKKIFATFIGTFIFFFVFLTRDISAQTTYSVTTSYQGSGSSDQDDMSVWVHPTNSAQSTIIASDKAANKIFVYNLDGSVVQSFASGEPGNIDLRYGFTLSGQKIDIVAYNERSTGLIRVYKVNADRTLTQIDDGNIKTLSPNYGFALYKSPKSGKMYGFVSEDSGVRIEQYELSDNGSGKVKGSKVRFWSVGAQTEGMVADDEKSLIYMGEEDHAIWKIGAEPTDPIPTAQDGQVIKTGQNGLAADIEGLTIYHTSNGGGYLIASSQGNSTFKVYDKNTLAYLKTFKVANASSTDGIDVSSSNLGGNFTQGIFLAHSGGAAIRGVKWSAIAQGEGLSIDTAWNPRGGVVITQTPVTNTPTIPPVTTTSTPRPTNTQTSGKPGDANGDGKVDGVDFVAWMSHYGQQVSGAINGDFNNNGNVDGVDYVIWFQNYSTAIPTAGNSPTSTIRPSITNTPPVTTTPTQPPVSGDFPCGKFPNASAGCMPVSYQSWFDNVPASSETMSVNYTPRLLHHHYECNVPAARANGQYLRKGMKIVCQFVRYNSVIPFTSSNSGWYRSQNQGSTYEQFNMNLSPCQSSKYLGKECKSENIHTVRDSDMSSATEIRYTPNANFVGLDNERHFLSSNWQTGIGYRSSSEFTTRYWLGTCGTYQRVILKQVDKYMKGSEPIPTVSGTITIPFETNGGCGSQFKTFVFMDPSQHVTVAGAQTGATLLETNSHFSGNLTWDTTKASNGLHSLLFINMEGTSKYVSASGVAVKYIVQN